MKTILFLSLLAVGARPVDHPETYLLSVSSIPLTDDQSIEAFSFETWGVVFKSVCSIPSGWRIKVGNSATPNGELRGEGSQGATWINESSPEALRRFVLVTLYAPVQRDDIRSGTGVIPATFAGHATVSTDDGERSVPLTYRNITLTPARDCAPVTK